jgi:hypothetical protein
MLTFDHLSPEGGGRKLLRTIYQYLPIYTAFYPRRLVSSSVVTCHWHSIKHVSEIIISHLLKISNFEIFSLGFLMTHLVGMNVRLTIENTIRPNDFML